MRSPYEILEVDRWFTKDELKTAYRKLVMKYHPDRNGNSKEANILFKEVVKAYGILSDREKKWDFDMRGIIEDDEPNELSNIVSKFTMNPDEEPENIKRNTYGLTDEDEKIRDINLEKISQKIDKKYQESYECWVCSGVGIMRKEVGFFVHENTCQSCNGKGFKIREKIQYNNWGNMNNTNNNIDNTNKGGEKSGGFFNGLRTWFDGY